MVLAVKRQGKNDFSTLVAISLLVVESLIHFSCSSNSNALAELVVSSPGFV